MLMVPPYLFVSQLFIAWILNLYGKHRPVARGHFNIDGVGDYCSGGGRWEYLNISTAAISLKLNLCHDVSNKLIYSMSIAIIKSTH